MLGVDNKKKKSEIVVKTVKCQDMSNITEAYMSTPARPLCLRPLFPLHGRGRGGTLGAFGKECMII